MLRLQTYLLAASIAVGAPLSPQAETIGQALEQRKNVDLAIVFAVDASASVDQATAELQKRGHVEALRSAEIIDFVSAGEHGCIAIAYIEWSDVGKWREVLPWHDICDANGALQAAAHIERYGDRGFNFSQRGRTSISSAIEVSSLMLEGSYPHATRKFINLSTNGANNDGCDVETCRHYALSRGHVINAISPSATEDEMTGNFMHYLKEKVIGGTGSMAATAQSSQDYLEVLRDSLAVQIAGGTSPITTASTSDDQSPIH